MTGGEGGTIHIAPCQCELHVRIRELESEVKRDNLSLNVWTKKWRELEADCVIHRKSRDEAWARAEKAEEALKVYQDAESIWRARAEKAEARVAELEAEAWDAHMEHGVGRHCRRCEPAPAIEGQEREAD